MAVSSQDFSLWSPDIPSICGLFWTDLRWKLFRLQVSLWCGFSHVSNFSLLRNQSIVMDSGYSAQFLYKRTLASEFLVATEIYGARYCIAGYVWGYVEGCRRYQLQPSLCIGLRRLLVQEHTKMKWSFTFTSLMVVYLVGVYARCQWVWYLCGLMPSSWQNPKSTRTKAAVSILLKI